MSIADLPQRMLTTKQPNSMRVWLRLLCMSFVPVWALFGLLWMGSDTAMAQTPATYTVQPGDTLAEIATRWVWI